MLQAPLGGRERAACVHSMEPHLTKPFIRPQDLTWMHCPLFCLPLICLTCAQLSVVPAVPRDPHSLVFLFLTGLWAFALTAHLNRVHSLIFFKSFFLFCSGSPYIVPAVLYYVDQAGPKCMEIRLPLPPRCQD